jgi:hypothetical protein
VEEPAELAISWDSTLSVSQNIYRCNVPGLAIGSGDLAEKVWVIVVRDRSWIIDAKAVEGISECGFFVNRVLCLLKSEIGDWCRFCVGPCYGVEECDVVWSLSA